MARLARLILAGFAHHVVHRAVTGDAIFRDDDDQALFLQLLFRFGREHRVAIHAYVLLKTEVQLIVTPTAVDGLGRMMQAISRIYVPTVNRRHGRSGALWQSRFRAGPVGGADPLLQCMLYVDQAPTRQGVAETPLAFAASSARVHAGLRIDALLAPVPSESAYWALGNTPFEREAAYRRLLELPLAESTVAAIEGSTLKGWAYGPVDALRRMSALAGRRTASLPRGRPKQVA